MYDDPETDVNSRREFLILEDAQQTRGKREAGDFEFSAHQLFVRNFVSPITPNRRVHLKSGTGVGKTIGSLLPAKEFIKADRQVLIIGFQERRFFDELMKQPELGYVTSAEVAEMTRLRQIADSTKSEDAINRIKNMRTAISKRFKQHITIQGYKKFTHEIMGVDGPDNPQINFGIIEKYRHGLVIYDESQNAYNALERNNWGRAIQLLLNVLGPDVHALSVSATPVTISSELRDFLHLMTETPRFDIKKLQSDIEDAGAASGDDGKAPPAVVELVNSIIDFTHPSLTPYAIPSLKESAEVTDSIIASRLRGKILYMPDSVLEHIPHRIYHGESIPGINYLKFTRVKMSDAQADASKKSPTNNQLRDLGGLLPAIGTMAASNGPSDVIADAQASSSAKGGVLIEDETHLSSGVFKDDLDNGETFVPVHQLQVTDRREMLTELSRLNNPEMAKYRDKLGIKLFKTDTGTYLSGSVLREPDLSTYSTKYAHMLELIRNARMGKILIYHNHVHGTGVLTIQEVFKQNGIIGATDSPNEFTLCTFCGNRRGDDIHNGKMREAPFDQTEAHGFVPMRFLVVHGLITPNQVHENTEMFNSPQNIWGRDYRIMLGSRKIREGTDYNAVQTQIVLSIPENIAILIQLFGRSARNYSHIDLPAENNYVHLYILVGSYGDDELTPEERDYKNKMDDYLIVQRYDKVMNRVAVDAYVLHTPERLLTSIKANLAVNDAGAEARTYTDDDLTMRLGPQPYTLAPRERIAASLVKNTTYYALERFGEEMATIQYLITLALNERNIWCIGDLWEYVRMSKGTPNPAMFEHRNFLAALRTMSYARVIGSYVIYGVGDIEEHSRRRVPHEAIRLMQISYFKDERLMAEMSARIAEKKTAQNTVTLMQVFDIYERYSIDIHLRVIQRAIEEVLPAGLAFYGALFKLYTAKDLRQTTTNATKIVGYNFASRMHYLDTSRTWKTMNYSEAHTENDIIVGMYTPNMQFKIRAPQRSERKVDGLAKDIDLRKVERGIVCKTKNKKDLFVIANKLGIEVNQRSARIPLLCEEIKLELLKRESKHAAGLKWVYMHD